MSFVCLDLVSLALLPPSHDTFCLLSWPWSTKAYSSTYVLLPFLLEKPTFVLNKPVVIIL